VVVTLDDLCRLLEPFELISERAARAQIGRIARRVREERTRFLTPEDRAKRRKLLAAAVRHAKNQKLTDLRRTLDTLEAVQPGLGRFLDPEGKLLDLQGVACRADQVLDAAGRGRPSEERDLKQALALECIFLYAECRLRGITTMENASESEGLREFVEKMWAFCTDSPCDLTSERMLPHLRTVLQTNVPDLGVAVGGQVTANTPGTLGHTLRKQLRAFWRRRFRMHRQRAARARPAPKIDDRRQLGRWLEMHRRLYARRFISRPLGVRTRSAHSS
jgi:hypothetical protein